MSTRHLAGALAALVLTASPVLATDKPIVIGVRSACRGPTAWSRPPSCRRRNWRSRRSTSPAACSAASSPSRSRTTHRRGRRPEGVRFADLPEEGRRHHRDGDERGPQCRPARRHQGPRALHLHSFYEAAPATRTCSSTAGCRAAGAAGDRRLQGQGRQDLFPRRQRLRLRPRHAGLHAQLHREDGRQGRRERIPADGRQRLDRDHLQAEGGEARRARHLDGRRRPERHADEAAARRRRGPAYANLAVDEGTAKSMGKDADGIYLSASYVTGIDSPQNKAFLAAMEKKFGSALRTPNDLSVPDTRRSTSTRRRSRRPAAPRPPRCWRHCRP